MHVTKRGLTIGNLCIRISSALDIPETKVMEYGGLYQKTETSYRVFHIKKKRKPEKYRSIYIPCAEVKLIQRYIVDTILSTIKVHKAATAYVKGTSITDHAVIHRKNDHFLLLDIEDFFNSMDQAIFFGILQKNLPDYPESDIRLIIALCSCNGKFVQGCVSSPAIANIYLYEFDKAMSKLAETLPSGRYSRYSDDIAFSSSERIPDTLPGKVADELKSLHLCLNTSKTRFISNKNRLRITGIRIRDDKSLGLDTKFKKELKKEIYEYLKSVSSSNISIGAREHLLGKLSYLRMVDPFYFEKLNRKYQREPYSLFEYIKRAPFPKVAIPVHQDVISAANSPQCFCYVDKDEPGENRRNRTAIGLILYEGIYEQVTSEISEETGNLFLSLAYFRFKRPKGMEMGRVYVATTDGDSSNSTFLLEDVVPCPYLTSIIDQQRRHVAFREPSEAEEEDARRLLTQWKRIEEDD